MATLLRQGRLPVGLDSPHEESSLKEEKDGEREAPRVKKAAEESSRAKREAFLGQESPRAEAFYDPEDLLRAAYVDDNDYYSPINKRYFGKDYPFHDSQPTLTEPVLSTRCHYSVRVIMQHTMNLLGSVVFEYSLC